MFDVITFGSATQDIFLELPLSEDILKEFNAKKYFCLPLGGKFLVDEMQFFSGGGGTNVACSLANLGLKTAYYGKIGDDASGKIILVDLAKFGVSSRLCQKDRSLPTAVSFVISCGNDRTILVYKGACHFLTKPEINFNILKRAQWLYLAPFYEKTAELLFDLVFFAKNNNIRVVINPSIFQITRDDPDFKIILAGADILLLNREEAGILINNPALDIKEMAKEVFKICSNLVVITEGERGAIVFDGENFYQSGIYKVAVEDKTGAGDSFGAGFLAGLLRENNIEYAIRLGMINSAKNISQKGAKIGLLNKAELKILPSVDITKERAY